MQSNTEIIGYLNPSHQLEEIVAKLQKLLNVGVLIPIHFFMKSVLLALTRKHQVLPTALLSNFARFGQTF